MGFRYDMRGKDPQIQAIVRKRDEEERRRKEERKKKSDIKCREVSRNGQYTAVEFLKENNVLLELRISIAAILNESCGLKDLRDEDIILWLCNTGKTYIHKVKTFETVQILATDVVNKEIITSWENLRREVPASD